MQVSNPVNKFRGLQLVRTLARGWKTATIRRLTSGSYPYDAHRRRAAHTGHTTQAITSREPYDSTWHPVQGGSGLTTNRPTCGLSRVNGCLPLRGLCLCPEESSTASVTQKTSLRLQWSYSRQVKRDTRGTGLCLRTAFFSSPWLKPGVSKKGSDESRLTIGGDERIRTAGAAFAEPCLTTWRRRHVHVSV